MVGISICEAETIGSSWSLNREDTKTPGYGGTQSHSVSRFGEPKMGSCKLRTWMT
jgi:hypothetical protein